MATTLTRCLLSLFTVLLASSLAQAEIHTISLDNRCGKGTPQLIIGGKVVSKGEPYTFSGTASGIAYLQTGECGFNGEKCTLLEFNLANPTCPGCGSSTDISLISPHAFNVETSFSYYSGCDGQGATCSSGTCKTAFFVPDDNQVQVQCEANNVNLRFTFCGSGSQNIAGQSSSHATSSSARAEATKTTSRNAAPVVTPITSPQTSAPPEKAPISSASLSAASARPTVNRGSCKNKKRRTNLESHRHRRRGGGATLSLHGLI